MGEDVGAVWMGAALNKINAQMEFEEACQTGQADPNWDLLEWWQSPARKAFLEWKNSRAIAQDHKSGDGETK